MALDTIPLWLPLLLVLPLLLLMKKKMDERSSKNLPPSPPKLPIIGNLHQLGVLPHQSMCQLSKKYGSVMLLQLSGIRTVIISSADAAREVLKVHDLACCSRPPLACSKVFSYNYRDMAFSPYGNYWREIRKICVLELFSVKRVQSYQFIREEEVALFVDSISNYASSATPIDLSEKLFALTASITFRIGFGKSFRGSGFDNERFQAVVHEVVSMIGSYNASEFFPFVGWIIDTLSGRLKRLERVFQELDTLFQQVIDLHLDPERTKPEHEDIIDVLLRIEREQEESGPSGDAARFTKHNIKAVLLNIFLGGIDTGAITMIWAMAELAKNPRLMKKAQDEVRNFIGNKGKVTESDTDHLHYLKMIVKETFRLHPPATLLLPRETMSHFKINGYDIYPKMLVQVNAWAIGRDPKYWENPEEFIPERFMDNSIDYKGQNFELLTFGSGRRGCPGIYMATTTIELALANLLYCFNWKLPDGTKEEDINMEERAGHSITAGKKTALNLVPIKFSKNLPPSPPKLPIIGNLHQLGVLPHQSMWQLSKKYGSVMLLQLSGIRTVIISSADAAREVLKVHDLACCSRPPLACSKVFSYNYRDMAFSPYGDYWREIRKICVLELFSVKRVQSYQFIREEEVALFVDSISHYASSATPIDLSEKLFALTASITFRIGFGKSFRGSGLDNERFQAVVHEVESMIGSYNASEFLPFVGWIIDTLSGRFKRLERVFHELDTLFQQVIDLHLDPERTKPEHEDIIDVLLRIEREQEESGPSGDAARFTKHNIKAVLLNIFLGGIDTGAITMIWAMAELAKNPRLMKKAQDEVRNFIGNKGKVTESDTDHLHYLKMIVKETFRLHPPATLLLPRETVSHFKISGYDIYPKMLVQVNAWAIGRDPKYWENPEEFIPERFMDNSIDYKGQNFELLTFGSGRRGCPGIYMATTTIELALANLLYCFNWKLPDGMKEEDINMEEGAGLSLTTSKKTALNLVPIKLF
ncbi:hypothetical protein SO802_011935 [Lithocarpus litseifolius]|uniref:Cytochrome P450 n=1 Tax=Lithocarpus litseifolius TaxID=425828 RepID=A0AAW2D405_9ROSI